MNMILRSFSILSHYLSHPIGRVNRLATLWRMVRWQVGSSVLGFDVVVPWIDGTRLLVRKGMHGATGNVYVGLMEFEDMTFVLHLLREKDSFIDVGANVGVYSLLAASRGASSLALEPVPTTFNNLLDNIHINRYETQITARNIGVGSIAGNLRFSLELGPINHVLSDAESKLEFVTVDIEALDDIANSWQPVMIKIDVEGFESEVIRGATELLSQLSLLAVLIELNGLGARYGFSDTEIHKRLMEFEFSPMRYDPFARRLLPLDHHQTSGNTLYVRNSAALERRLSEAQQAVWGEMKI